MSELTQKFTAWKAGLEPFGLQVYMNKTKVLRSTVLTAQSGMLASTRVRVEYAIKLLGGIPSFALAAKSEFTVDAPA